VPLCLSVEVFHFRVWASLFGYTSGMSDKQFTRLSQTPHYSFGSLTGPLIQYSFAPSFPPVTASGSSHSLLSVSFTFGIIFRTLSWFFAPSSLYVSTAEICIAFACICSNLAFLSFHPRYSSYAAPLHIYFSLANITCTTLHIISEPTMLPCTSLSGIRHNPYTHLSLFALLSTRDL